MRSLSSLRFLGLAVVLLGPGCQFYFGGDDDCESRTYDWAPPPPSLLDPETLECVGGGGGGGGCGDDFGASDFERPGAGQDWAVCNGACTGLGEGSCLASDGCRAIYQELESCGPDGQCSWTKFFETCVGTAPSGPIRGGECGGLDAHSCSLHDDCVAMHYGVPGLFKRCENEAAPCDPVPLSRLRNPETGQCENWSGGGCGEGFTPPTPDWGSCFSPCQDLDEDSCKAADACRAIYANACPPNADCYAPRFKECWPTAPSGPVRGGECQGLDAYTCSLHDDCTAEHDSDWSGCMDPAACDWTVGRFITCNREATTPPPPPPACTTLGEAGCIARDDCTPLYQGEGCTCGPAGCTCEHWTFDACEAG